MPWALGKDALSGSVRTEFISNQSTTETFMEAAAPKLRAINVYVTWSRCGFTYNIKRRKFKTCKNTNLVFMHTIDVFSQDFRKKNLRWARMRVVAVNQH